MRNIFLRWRNLRRLPSAWLLMLQLTMLLILPFTTGSLNSNATIWGLGTLVLLLIAVIIRRSPIYSTVGLGLVLSALLLSVTLMLGYTSTYLQVVSNLVEAAAYIYAAAGLLMYMFADRYLTSDELFAAAAVFTLFAWAFAFLYNACQIIYPESFSLAGEPVRRSWVELLFLSFSVQSNTGLSDLVPATPQARMLVALQMFVGVMYLTLIVSRLVTLHYVRNRPVHEVHEQNENVRNKADEES
ncbi:ion channel [Alkanindiges sp. WGS2144]|uniref:ion channel n=1 Tax=Alkanindiges sp. WGS2144 TaxID=3366808 RepID=UPI0037531CD9